ncbi:c-type cytochrome [Aromatoleum sp.]|uniref:c-type cytochrome n=1 Tax=Aromatoleum sp. TaxID=2307007 RepID=UPI002FC8BFA0
MRRRGTVAFALAMFSASASALAANIGEGQRIYQMHCLGCHGVGGQSAIPTAPNFARSERLMQPDTTLMMSIKAGKMTMPSFNGILRDQQILDVIAYLRTLQR